MSNEHVAEAVARAVKVRRSPSSAARPACMHACSAIGTGCSSGSKQAFYNNASRFVQVLEALANKEEVPLQLPEMGTKRLPPRQAQLLGLHPCLRRLPAAQDLGSLQAYQLTVVLVAAPQGPSCASAPHASATWAWPDAMHMPPA